MADLTATPDRWKVAPDGPGIAWEVAADARLPHADHLEMSGRRVSLILHYGVDADRRLTLSRKVIWPTLRTKPGDVRGYLIRTYEEDAGIGLRLEADSRAFAPGPVRRIAFDGVFTVEHEPAEGLAVTRTIFPSVNRPAVIEVWRLENVGTTPVELAGAGGLATDRHENGVYGDYDIGAMSDGLESPTLLRPGQAVVVHAAIWARRNPMLRAERFSLSDCPREERQRRKLCTSRMLRTLAVQTPDPVLNRAFEMAKLRAAESLFDTQMGLVHSPGGGRYYGGVWANDQAEYSGPLFAYLGDPEADEAALTAYRVFARHMHPDYAPVPTSLEIEGTREIHAGGDRGDAAMIASGLTRYLLARGDRTLAEELWPTVAWCLEYVRRKTTPEGVVASDSDELEGRFPTGDANLSTAALAYDGLRRGADLALALGKPDQAAEYRGRADHLAAAVERHFGATVEGFETYRYYDGNTTLRAWICLPLCFGMADGARKTGTIEALFSPRLWTPDGLATEAGDKVFWDRSTLYALRGVFFAGATETAWSHLTAFSRRRLLGDHVPYPVEAYPEGGQAHLSAESALYCRIFTEGLLGMVPTGFRSFTLTPRLPAAWPSLRCRMAAFGHRIEILVARKGAELRTRVRVRTGGENIDVLDVVAADGATHAVELPGRQP